MWIIPKNHPLYSQCALECLDSIEDLKEQSEHLEQRLTWKSNLSRLQTWCARWKRVFWIPLLFSRTLKHSHQKSFETKLTEYFAHGLANLSLSQENSREKTTQGIYGHTLIKSSTQLSLDLFSEKTSPITLTSDMKLSGDDYKNWAIMLRKEYTARRKSAHLTAVNAYSSSQFDTDTASECWATPRAGKTTSENPESWMKRNQNKDVSTPPLALQVSAIQPTPTTMENQNNVEKFQERAKRLKLRNNGKNGTKHSGNGAGPSLSLAVQMNQWPTPHSNSMTGAGAQGRQGGMNLQTKVQKESWTTPSARDWKDTAGMSTERDGNEQGRLDQLPRQVYHQNQLELAKRPTPTTAEAGKISNQANYGQKGLSNHPEIVSLPKRSKAQKDRAGIDGQPDQDKSNTTGKNPESSAKRLNPKWVLQLCGTAFEKTFFVWRGMP